MKKHRLIPLLAGVLALTACGNPDLQEEVDQLRSDVSALKEAATTTSTSPASTTTAPPPTTTTSSTSTTTSSSVPDTVPPTTIPPAPPTTEPDLPPFPPEIDALNHGDMVWVVILAASEGYADPILNTATLAAEDAGYATGPTDCDSGASEALGLTDAHYFTVSVYLSSEEDAMAAKDAFAARGIGGTVAEIQAFCLD